MCNRSTLSNTHYLPSSYLSLDRNTLSPVFVRWEVTNLDKVQDPLVQISHLILATPLDSRHNQGSLCPGVLDHWVQVQVQDSGHSSKAGPKEDIDAQVFAFHGEYRACLLELFTVFPELQGTIQGQFGGMGAGVTATA